MKKILFFVPTFPSLSQTFIAREIVEIVKTGEFAVQVLSLKAGAKAQLPKELENLVEYYSRSKFGRILDGLVFLLVNPGTFFRIWFKFFHRPLTFGTAMSVVTLIKKFKPDLIHANWISEGALLANILSDLTGIPYSIECHAEDIWFTKKSEIKKRIEDSKFVITCTRLNLEYLKELVDLKDISKLNVVHHYIHPNIFMGNTASCDNDPPVIYLVGRYIEKKGFEYMIRAASILLNKGLNFKVRFAGTDVGNYKHDLKKLSEQLGTSSRITFLDQETFEEHGGNYLTSDILVVPSVKTEKGDMDGIPNVLVEGMLAGLPVVASRVSAIPEVVDDGVSGYLVAEKDANELAEKIETLIRNKELRKKMGEAGRAKILSMFSRENTLDKMSELFRIV